MDKVTATRLARMVSGQLFGDGSLLISGAATISTARKGDITLAEHSKFSSALGECQASAALVPHGFRPDGITAIAVDDVRLSFSQIVKHFRPTRQTKRIGISVDARISDTAAIGANTDVHPFAVIGDDVEVGSGCTIHAHVTVMPGCRIADNVTVFPGAVLYEDTVIGENSTIHANASLGAFGFGYDTKDGKHTRGDQLGYVEIGEDVEIGAGTTVDRGTYGPTIIGKGTKIDNQVMVAHNCRIGNHNIICSQVGIAGSSTTGNYVVMAGQVGVPDHVKIGDRAILGAKAGIMRDVEEGTRVVGIPATPERDQLAKQAVFAKLPEMRRQLKKLQRVVDQLTTTKRFVQDDAA